MLEKPNENIAGPQQFPAPSSVNTQNTRINSLNLRLSSQELFLEELLCFNNYELFTFALIQIYAIFKMNIIRLSRSLVSKLDNNGFRYILICRHSFANAARDTQTTSVSKSDQNKSQVSTNVKFIAATKTTGYFLSSLAAGGLFLLIGYGLYKELFSSDSPLGLASHAIDRYKEDPTVQKLLGEPIRVIGQEHYNKSRRRHPQVFTFSKDNKKYIQTKCVMIGPNNRGDLFVEFREKDEKSFWSSNWDVLYASLKLTDGRLFVIERNYENQINN